MAYLSAVVVLLAATLCVDSHPVTFHYTRTHAQDVSSGRGISPHHKTSLLGCAVQSALKKRVEQCFFYDVAHGVCDATTLPLICNYRQLNKTTETNKKILFMVCRHGSMCKFMFVPGPGAVNTIKIESFALSYKIFVVRYHQTLNTFYWSKGLFATTILSTVASNGMGKKYNHKKMPFRVMTFDIDNNVNYMFVLSVKALHKGGVSTNDFVTLVQGRFYRSDSIFLDKINRSVYYTCTCTSKSRQDLMRVSYDGKLNTRIASILTRMSSFVVDDKGWNVFVCKSYLYRYNVNTTASTQLKSLNTVKCSGMSSDGQYIYVPAMRKDCIMTQENQSAYPRVQSPNSAVDTNFGFHTELGKSGRAGSSQHKSPWVQSALKKLADQCSFYDVSNGSCDASKPLPCNYRYLSETTKTNKKFPDYK